MEERKFAKMLKCAFSLQDSIHFITIIEHIKHVLYRVIRPTIKHMTNNQASDAYIQVSYKDLHKFFRAECRESALMNEVREQFEIDNTKGKADSSTKSRSNQYISCTPHW